MAGKDGVQTPASGKLDLLQVPGEAQQDAEPQLVGASSSVPSQPREKSKFSIYTSEGSFDSLHRMPRTGSKESAKSRDHDPDALMNNAVADVLAAEEDGEGGSGLTKCFTRMGLVIEENGDVSVAHSRRKDEDRQTRWASKSSTSLQSTVDGQRAQELMRDLFNLEQERYVVRPAHHSLDRILRHIFSVPPDPTPGERMGQMASRFSSKSMESYASLGSDERDDFMMRFHCSRLLRIRKQVSYVMSSTPFSTFFVLLTIYALFVPDSVVLWGNSTIDFPFLIANTVVFLVFVVELGLLLATQGGLYVLSIHFLLDVICVLSLLTDTIFFSGAFLGDRNRDVTRLARSSRIARLARLGRVARLAKLVPKILRFIRKKNMVIAEQIFIRRLWKIFSFLAQGVELGGSSVSLPSFTEVTSGDTTSSLWISAFDFKVVYLLMLRECHHIFWKEDHVHLLEGDTPMLSNLCAPREDMRRHLNFEDVSRKIVNSRLGERMVRWHQDDLEDVEGVWQLTARLTDTTAIKVCVGILILLGVQSALDFQPTDNTTGKGLVMLDYLAQVEHQAPGGRDGDYLCREINRYASIAPLDSLLYLFLDGFTYYNLGCLGGNQSAAFPFSALNPFDRVSTLQDQLFLRENEVDWKCWSPSSNATDCQAIRNAGITKFSMTLKTVRADYQNTAQMSLILILVIIALLFIFISLLSMKINTFSMRLLQPLRFLVDDMTSMSSFDLVQVEEYVVPSKDNKKEEVAEEIKNLTVAFKHMKTAIRSWSKYVPPTVVERLFAAGIEAQIGVTRTEVTVLFVDIENFEAKCSGLDPNIILDNLAAALGIVAAIIEKHNGTLLEFIGDEVLASFNAPSPMQNHAMAAVSAAIEIHDTLADAQSEHSAAEESLLSTIQFRCGVHTGLLLHGNLGSTQRMKYGLLGDAINLTARMKGLNSRYKTRTLVSDKACEQAKAVGDFLYRPVDLVAVKGKKEPTRIFEVWSWPTTNAVAKEVAEAHAKGFTLYLERKFEEARSVFTKVSEDVIRLRGGPPAGDEVSRQMLSRCEEYIRNPPPADWDGVDRLKAKTFTDTPAPSPAHSGQHPGAPSGTSLVAQRGSRAMPAPQDQEVTSFEEVDEGQRAQVSCASCREGPSLCDWMSCQEASVVAEKIIGKVAIAKSAQKREKPD